jgi:U3 small nucleolar RNA-associated protein 12
MAFNDHHGEVWSIALSSIGDQLFSVSADKSVRVWKQTNDQMLLEEEKEKEAENFILEELDTQNVAVFLAKI